MPETTPLIKAALNLRGGAGFDVYIISNESGKVKPKKVQKVPTPCFSVSAPFLFKMLKITLKTL